MFKIYEYQRNDGTHYYAGAFRRGEACMYELEVVLPDGFEAYETATGETAVMYRGTPNPLSQCLLPNRETPTLSLMDERGNSAFYSLRIVSRQEISSIMTID